MRPVPVPTCTSSVPPRSGSPLSTRSSQNNSHLAQQAGLGGLGGSGQYVEPGGRDRGEGGTPPSHESGEKQLEPAVDATHQGGAFIQQIPGAFGFVRDQGPDRRAPG